MGEREENPTARRAAPRKAGPRLAGVRGQLADLQHQMASQMEALESGAREVTEEARKLGAAAGGEKED